MMNDHIIMTIASENVPLQAVYEETDMAITHMAIDLEKLKKNLSDKLTLLSEEWLENVETPNASRSPEVITTSTKFRKK